VGMLGLGVRLWILFYLWGEYVIFLSGLCLRVGLFCLNVGVWSVRLVGLCGLGGCLRIMKY
jgi:hypothetical protein